MESIFKGSDWSEGLALGSEQRIAGALIGAPALSKVSRRIAIATAPQLVPPPL
jgi:hypothetical protein